MKMAMCGSIILVLCFILFNCAPASKEVPEVKPTQQTIDTNIRQTSEDIELMSSLYINDNDKVKQYLSTIDKKFSFIIYNNNNLAPGGWVVVFKAKPQEIKKELDIKDLEKK